METLLGNLLDYFEAGGFVMPFLLALSAGMWGAIFERWLYLYSPLGLKGGWSMSGWRRDLESAEAEAVRFRRLGGREEAARLRNFCEAQGGELAAFVNRALLERDVSSPEALDLSLEEAFLACSERTRRRLPVIGVMTAMSPMLGLLGTVAGMIEAFENMMLAGGADAKALSGGISAALITTQVGLVVALPGIFTRSMFRRRADAIERGLRLLCMRLRGVASGRTESPCTPPSRDRAV